jgi:hypothetical protein
LLAVRRAGIESFARDLEARAELCRAAPHAVCSDGCGDHLADLPCAGFIGALQWRCANSVSARAALMRWSSGADGIAGSSGRRCADFVAGV